MCQTCGRYVPSDDELWARQQAQAVYPEALRDVPFPYGVACQAIRACRETAGLLRGDLDLRPEMLETLSDWTGGYREDYDQTWLLQEGVLSGLEEGLTLLASEIEDAWDAADTINNRREETRTSPDYDPRDYDPYSGR